MANRVNDLLLPIVKGVGSERAWVLLGTESLQTLGGSGFLQEYPIEQYIRDAKIDTLYEGTTAIQGLDFFFRKIIRDKAQALSHVALQMQEFAKDLGADGGRLDTERELLGKGLEDVQGILGYMVGELMKSDPRQDGGDVTNLYKVGQNTSRLLLSAGDLSSAGCCCARPRWPRGPLRAEGVSAKDARLLRGQDRGGVVLRAQRPAEDRGRAPDRRGDRQRADGRPRVRLLTRPSPHHAGMPRGPGTTEGLASPGSQPFGIPALRLDRVVVPPSPPGTSALTSGSDQPAKTDVSAWLLIGRPST